MVEMPSPPASPRTATCTTSGFPGSIAAEVAVRSASPPCDAIKVVFGSQVAPPSLLRAMRTSYGFTLFEEIA